jgi:hypothetical protein
MQCWRRSTRLIVIDSGLGDCRIGLVALFTALAIWPTELDFARFPGRLVVQIRDSSVVNSLLS